MREHVVETRGGWQDGSVRLQTKAGGYRVFVVENGEFRFAAATLVLTVAAIYTVSDVKIGAAAADK